MSNSQDWLKQMISDGEEHIVRVKELHEDLWKTEVMVTAFKIALNFQDKGYTNE